MRGHSQKSSRSLIITRETLDFDSDRANAKKLPPKHWVWGYSCNNEDNIHFFVKCVFSHA